MDNQPSFDRSLFIPIGVGIFALLGICVILASGRLNQTPAAVEEVPTATAFQYAFIGTEPAGVKPGDDLALPENLAAQLPAISTTLPFLLLILATLRLPLANPSPVFGLTLLLVVMLLGVTRLFSYDWMPAVGLACVTALECAWHFYRFDPADTTLPLTWYLVFFAVLTAFPFLFFKNFSDRVVPWAAAAMAGPLQSFLVHRLVRAAYDNEVMGLLPAAFAVPPLVSLVMVLKNVPGWWTNSPRPCGFPSASGVSNPTTESAGYIRRTLFSSNPSPS